VGNWAYQNIDLVRYLEEAAAQSYAKGSLRAGLKFPLEKDYGLTKSGVLIQGAAYVGGTAAASAGSYEAGKLLFSEDSGDSP
jgi:hypothetical protein